MKSCVCVVALALSNTPNGKSAHGRVQVIVEESLALCYPIMMCIFRSSTLWGWWTCIYILTCLCHPSDRHLLQPLTLIVVVYHEPLILQAADGGKETRETVQASKLRACLGC